MKKNIRMSRIFFAYEELCKIYHHNSLCEEELKKEVKNKIVHIEKIIADLEQEQIDFFIGRNIDFTLEELEEMKIIYSRTLEYF